MPGKGDSSVLVWKLLTEGQFQTLQIYLRRLVAGEDRWAENGEGEGWLVGRSKVSPPSPLLRRRKPLQKLLPRDNSKSWSNCCIITALKLPSHHHSLHRGVLTAGFSFCILAPPLNTEVFLYRPTKFDGLGGWFHCWGLKFWELSSINWLIFWGSLSKFLWDLIWVVALFMWRRAY